MCKVDVKKLPTSLIQVHCFKFQSYPRLTKILQFTSFATPFVFGKKLAALTTKDCATKVSIKQVLMYYTDLYIYIYKCVYVSAYILRYNKTNLDHFSNICHEFLLISFFNIFYVFVSNEFISNDNKFNSITRIDFRFS